MSRIIKYFKYVLYIFISVINMIKKWNARLYFPGFFPDLFPQDVVSMIFSHTSSHTNKVFPRLVPWSFHKKVFYIIISQISYVHCVFSMIFSQVSYVSHKFPRFPPENLHSSVPNFQPKQKRPVIEASGWNKLYHYFWYNLHLYLHHCYIIAI